MSTALATDFRKQAIDFQHEIKGLDGVLSTREEIDKVNPLVHKFADGMYIREIFMPAGQIIVSATHKQTHPYFIMSGEVSVATDEGVVKLKAPYTGITKAGTKRILYTHEDTTWITVHSTDKTTLDELEKELVNWDNDIEAISEEKIEQLMEGNK